MFHELNQGFAPRSVDGSNTGDVGVNEAVQFPRENRQGSHITALAKAIQGDRPAMPGHHPGTEETRIERVVFRGQELNGFGGRDVLHNTDVGWNSLIGEAVRVALVLPGQKGQDICPQNIGWNDDDRFAVFSHLNLGVPRKDLVKLKPVGFSRFDIAVLIKAVLIKMKAVFRFYLLNSLGVGIDHQVQELSLPRCKLREVFSFAVEQGIKKGRESLVHLSKEVFVQS